jgi:hypothetical protein
VGALANPTATLEPSHAISPARGFGVSAEAPGVAKNAVSAPVWTQVGRRKVERGVDAWGRACVSARGAAILR